MLSPDERYEEDKEQINFIMEWAERKEQKKSLRKNSKRYIKESTTNNIKD